MDLQEIYGCDQPEDDLPEIGSLECEPCMQFVHHDERNPHGQWHIGPKGYGFRTNRCPRSWATHPFSIEVQRFSWDKAASVLLHCGPNPPALLVEAVEWFSTETNAVLSEKWREDEEKRERDANETRGTP